MPRDRPPPDPLFARGDRRRARSPGALGPPLAARADDLGRGRPRHLRPRPPEGPCALDLRRDRHRHGGRLRPPPALGLRLAVAARALRWRKAAGDVEPAAGAGALRHLRGRGLRAAALRPGLPARPGGDRPARPQAARRENGFGPARPASRSLGRTLGAAGRDARRPASGAGLAQLVLGLLASGPFRDPLRALLRDRARGAARRLSGPRARAVAVGARGGRLRLQPLPLRQPAADADGERPQRHLPRPRRARRHRLALALPALRQLAGGLDLAALGAAGQRGAGGGACGWRPSSCCSRSTPWPGSATASIAGSAGCCCRSPCCSRSRSPSTPGRGPCRLRRAAPPGIPPRPARVSGTCRPSTWAARSGSRPCAAP